MRFLVLVICLSTLAFRIEAQNLVPNPGFEEYKELPNNSAQFNKLEYWFNPAGDVPAHSDYGTPDFFHKKGGMAARLPNTRMGKVQAMRGSGIAGLILYNKNRDHLVDFREYMCVELSQPLEEGKEYQVELHYSTGISNQYGKLASSDLQVAFSEEEPKQEGNKPLRLKPCYATSDLKVSADWEKISFTFVADRNHRFLVIGNFKRDKDTRIKEVHQEEDADDCAYYFIDEVSVIGKWSLYVSCPSEQTVFVPDDVCEAQVEYADPVVSGPEGSTLKRISGPASGSIFPVGKTMVEYQAISPRGDVAECSFAVMVRDTIPPVITCLQDIKVAADPKLRRTPLSYPEPVAGDNCGVPRIIRIEGPSPQAGFLKGTTTVKYRAIDKQKNITDCVFTVTVTEEPVEEVAEETEEEGITMMDELSDTEISEEPAKTVVTEEQTAITFGVEKPKPLQLKCPEDMVVSTDPGRCDKVVPYRKPEWSGPRGSKFGRTEGLASRERFPIGSSVVTYRVEAPGGRNRTCSFKIEVVDKEPPIIVCPIDTLLKAGAGETSVKLAYPATPSTDNCSRAAVSSEGWPEGDLFPVGRTLVTFRATDEAGNSSDCTWEVKVEGLPETVGEESVVFQEDVIATRSNKIRVYFYDSQVKDNDIISINVDGEWVLQESRIKKKRSDFWKTDHVEVELEPGKLHYMAFKAIDEGSIPPCTISLMIVDEERNLIAERTVTFKIGESGGVAFRLR